MKNSYSIYKSKDKYRNEFIVYSDMGWCLTNIFKANKEDYLNVLGDVWKDCDEKTVNDIEISFYKRLKNSNLCIDSFESYPCFEGKMGATLRNYSGGNIEQFIRNIMARLHCFKLDSKTSKLIWLYMKLRKMKTYK